MSIGSLRSTASGSTARRAAAARCSTRRPAASPRRSTLARPPMSTRAVRPPPRRVAAWRDASLARRTAVLFAFRELLARRARRARRGDHRRARQGARRRRRRGAARPGGRRVRVRHPAAAARAVQRERVDRGRRRTRSGSRSAWSAVISPFNFPAMVPLWFVPIAIACGNAVVLKPSEKDPSAALLLAELFAEAGLPDGVLNVVQRRQGGGRRAARAPGRAGGVVRRLDADRPVRLRDRHRARQAGAGARRGEEPHGGAAGRRSRPGGRRGGQRRVRLGGGAVHGDLGAGGGRAGRRTSWSSGSPRGSRPAAHRRRPARLRHGPAGHRRAPRQGRLLRGRRRRRRREARWSTGGTSTSTATPDGFWLGPTLFDHVTPEMSIYTDEIFGPVLSVVRVGRTTRRWTWSTPARTATARRSSPTTAARPGASSTRWRSAWSASTCPIPVPMAYYSFGGWKSSLFGDTARARRRGRALLHPGQGRHRRWLDPRHGGVNLGFPTQT